MLLRLNALLLLLALLTSSAAAAETPESEYTTKYFGTVVTFRLSHPLPPDSSQEWWNSLPPALQDPQYIAARINTARQQAGRRDLVRPDEVLFELPPDSGQSEPGSYAFGYLELSPDEVRTLLADFGNLSQLFPAAQLTFSPLDERTFEILADGPDTPLAFDQQGVAFSLPAGGNASAMRGEVASAFRQHFGAAAAVGYLSYTAIAAEDGSVVRMIRFSVRIRPAMDETGEGAAT